MAPKGRPMWWVWISLLCTSTVARAEVKGQSSKSTGQGELLGVTMNYVTWTAERLERNATRDPTNTAPSTEEEPPPPNTTVKGTTENQISGSASSSVKYWVPLVFMVIALVTLYFTYRRNTERESRSRAGSIIESSDCISEDNPEAPGAANTIPHPEGQNQIKEETLPAKETDHGERTSTL